MVTFQQLRDAKPAAFEHFADGWQIVSGAMSEAKDRTEARIAAGMRNAKLEGEGADAAQARLKRLGENFHFTQVQCASVHAALHGFAADLKAAQTKLLRAVDDARTAGYTVQEDGSLHWTRPAAGAGAHPGTPWSDMTGAKEAEAKVYAGWISDALQQAADADYQWRCKLDALLADNDLEVTDADWKDARSDTAGVRAEAADSVPADAIPSGKTPQENADWWASLSEDERDQYLALYPEQIGRLDGLPSAVRDEANRAYMAEEGATTRMKLDGLRANEPLRYLKVGGTYRETPEWKEWNSQVQHYEKVKKGIQKIEERFAKTGEDGLPEAYLLGFSPKDDGRAIVATGNPDTARHTAVYVPGTGTDLSKIGGDMNRMNELWYKSSELSDGPVSTITWLGYDAPDNMFKDAPFSHYADDAASAHSSFLHGLNAAHDPSVDSHTTVIGHSYGSTVVGSTARQYDLPVDDVIFAGSPGVQVGSASDIGASHGVYNMELPGDIVPDVGQFGHGDFQGPVEIRRGNWGLPVIDFRAPGFITPSDSEFGATQLATDDVPADMDNHSRYWKKDSGSLANQAAVVTGNYDKAKTE
ncbi:hypothetical protein SRB5_63880 [Streptomyces sp. RB5]|uniref:DUF1023 domain-containing protein n=1 Tax=Streptomyces smaragdinus TaxID=2585196 RepID=A0A7K0CT53_9ACTN|nr:alpha/beta hydrolase [Streptomyces smaragdinus]MQY16192.1 hypothetical protein [Streptomyces smaragdinus]